jgi:hypothetical protein
MSINMPEGQMYFSNRIIICLFSVPAFGMMKYKDKHPSKEVKENGRTICFSIAFRKPARFSHPFESFHVAEGFQ